MAVDAQAHPPRFRLWIRRQNVAEGPFSLRFEAMDGKGILRVARPGVLIDPPARPVGLEERLSTQQLRSTRFILVWDGGRARQGHLLNRLEEAQLERLELERWLEMEVVVDGGFRYAVLPVSVPVAEARPSKPKSRRPSLSELRQALDSITVHGEEPDDVDSALASLTGPSANTNGGDAADAPPPGIAGRRPQPLNLEGLRPGLAAPPPPPPPRGAPVGRLSDFETARPRRGEALEERRTQLMDPPLPAHPAAPAGRPPGRVLADAPTVALDPRRELLALGEAEGPADEAEALALGEAEEGLEEAERLLLGAPEPEPTERGPVRPVAAPAAAPAAPAGAGGAAAFYAQFSDAEEEAVFSIDLPSHRQSTEHVTVRRGGDDESGAFQRDVLPPMREELPGARLALGKARTNHDLEDAVVVLPAASVRPAPPVPALPLRAPPVEAEPAVELEAHPAEEAAVLEAHPVEEAHPTDEPPTEPPVPVVEADARPPLPGMRPSPVGAHWKNAQTIPPADDGDGPVHRSSTTLVRHLRRKVEEQRARIAELEARVAELEAGGGPRG